MFVVPVLPPSFILRQNRRLAGTLELGFDKAYRTAYKGWKPQWDESEFILPKAYGDKKFTVELVLKTLKSMAGAEVCFDVETDGRHVLNNDLRCIGFYDGKVGITVPLLYRDGSRQDVALPDGTVENRAVWKPFWTPAEWPKVSSAIAQLLSGEGKLSAALAITQNGQYDRSVLRSQRASLRRAAPELPLDLDVPAGASGFTFDTLVAHHVIAPYLPHDLGFLAAMYTDAPYYKSSASGDAWSSAGDFELWLYCLRDVKATWLIAQKMKREVREVYPRAQAIFEHDTWHEQECERWRERGLHVHRPTLRYFRWRFSRMRDRAMKRMKDLIAARLAASKEQMKGELANTEGKLDETKAHALLELVSRLSGKLDFDEFEEEENREKHRAAQMAEAFNPNSLRELRALLLALGVPLTEVTKTGELSTAKELLTAARKELVAKGVAPSDDRVAFLDYLFAFRESSKMVSTFLVPEILGDGKLHATFGVHRVPTGRLHSSDPNLMNQPQEIRGMYVADEADWLEDSVHVIVAEDWDAGEMRLGAFLSGDEVYVKVFREYDAGTGPKPHFMNMNAIFGLPPTKAAAEQNPGPYRAAKVFIYAVAYGAGENTVYEQVREEMPDMAFAAFKIAFGNLKKRYPQFFKWQADNVKMVSRRGHYDSPLKGRRMFFFELSFDGEGSPEATVIANAPFQSGLADIVSEANKRVERDVVPKWKKLMLPAGAKKAEILKRWKGATLEGKDHKPEPIVLSAKQVELLQRYGERCHQFAQVHDELPYVVPKRIADEFVKELKAVSGMKPMKEELQADGSVKLVEQDWNMPADPHHSWRWKPVQETCGSMEVWLKADGKDEKGKPVVKRLKKFVAAEKACKELVDIELVYGSEVEWRGECGKCGTKKVVIVGEEKAA